MTTTLVPVESIAAIILTIRGQKVIMDSDLARLYGVPTRTLNQAVKRNPDRFPPDFMFQLTEEENECLRSQIVISNGGRGGSRYLPYAFTEYGAVMAASVLNSPKAVEVSVYVTRAFVQQRALLAAHADLALQLARLEKKLLAGFALHEQRLDDHDLQLEQIIDTLRALQDELADQRALPDTPRRPIGFCSE